MISINLLSNEMLNLKQNISLQDCPVCQAEALQVIRLKLDTDQFLNLRVRKQLINEQETWSRIFSTKASDCTDCTVF